MSVEQESLSYPSFEHLYSGRLYVRLLGLTADAGSSVQAVRAAVHQSPHVEAEVVALFAGADWREHLVGAVAILVGAASPTTLAALWRAFDSWSWVSPQLAVTAFLSEPAFETSARPRAEAGCPMQTDRIADLHGAERECLAGVRGSEVPPSRSSKALAALVYLCRHLPDTEAWLEAVLANEALQKTLADDLDGGDRIAAQWLENLRPLAGVLDHRSLIEDRLRASIMFMPADGRPLPGEPWKWFG